MRLTKSALVRLLALLLAFAMVAAACGSDDDDDAVDDEPEVSTDEGGDDTSPDDGADDDGGGIGVVEIEDDEDSASGPVPGGVLRFGVNAEVDGLNPTTSALSAPGLTMGNAVFDTLAVFDKDGNAIPFLAESFTPNDDFTSWTVTLREGVMFHDGTPLNADAAIQNFDAQRADPLVGLAVRPFVLEGDAGITKIDELSYSVNLTDPDRYWPASITGQLGMVASPAWLDAALEDPELNQEPIGTGPFRFDTRSQDSVTRFARNDDWWAGEVYLDAVEIVPVTDADVRVSLFLEGELDGLHTNDNPAIEVLLDEDGVQNAVDDTGDEQFDMLNTTAPPFDDIRARKALTFATPQETYVALRSNGVAQRADSPFAPGLPFHNPDVVQETDRPDEAVALAAEYCADFPENCTDNKINIVRKTSGPSVNQTREAELLAEGWKVAFNVSFEEKAEDAHIQDVALGLYQVADWRQFGAVDPGVDRVWLMCRTIGGISLNWPRLCDEDRDALILQAQNEPDPATRAALYQELAARLNQDYTYIFHLHTVWDIAYRDGIRGACNRTTPDGATELRCQIEGRTWFDSLWIEQ